VRAGSPRMLREINDRAAIDALLREGPLTRSDLDLAIGLSKPATAQLLTRLEEEGVVVKAGVRGGGRGPRAQLWAVNGSLAYVAAVDLTPQVADFVVADITGAVLAESRVQLPVATGADVVGSFGKAMARVAKAAGLTSAGLRHVVIGAQGAFDPRTGHLESAPHIPGWLGFDVPGRLSDELDIEVTIENDANLVAIEEMTAGRATAVDDFVLLWLSESVGGAVVVGRTLLRGATGGGGEIDWMRVPDPASVRTDDGTTRAGARFGDLVSSRAIIRLAAAHGIKGDTGWDAVSEALDAGADGEAFLDDLARRVATGVASIVSVVDPELVLLCGEVSRVGGEHLAQLVAARLHELVLPQPPVTLASVQGNAVRAGALQAALATVRADMFGLDSPTTRSLHRSRANAGVEPGDVPISRAVQPSPTTS
jgi:predicted NBD/HSP70 family sugar kinase